MVPFGPRKTAAAIAFSLAALFAQPAGARVLTITIEALIDGRDLLIIRDGSLQWDHRDFAAPGRHLGRNRPTVVTTEVDGDVVMDRVEWFPSWSRSAPAEIRRPERSRAFVALKPELCETPMSVRLIPVKARWSLKLVGRPSASNGHAIILDFNDNRRDGSTVYVAKVEILC